MIKGCIMSVMQEFRLLSRGEVVWSGIEGFANSCHHGAYEQWRPQELSTLPST